MKDFFETVFKAVDTFMQALRDAAVTIACMVFIYSYHYELAELYEALLDFLDK